MEEATERTELDEILPGFLYLGSLKQAENFDALKAHEITHVLTVGSGMKALYARDFSYQLVDSLEDTANELIITRFEECFSFIDHVKAHGGKLFVHCEGGVSRSATICCAYLMQLENLDTAEALARLQKLRPVVAPNPGFKLQLELFHKHHYVVSPEVVKEAKETMAAELHVKPHAPVSILSQDLFETPPENYSYELETSSKASNFINTILSETMPKKKKNLGNNISADDASIHAGRSFTNMADIAENVSLDDEKEKLDKLDRRTSIDRRVSTKLFDMSQETIDAQVPARSGTSSSPGGGRSHDDQDTKRMDQNRQGSLRRFRTNSSTACSTETDPSLLEAPVNPEEVVVVQSVKPSKEEESVEEATKVVGKVLLGYAMTPADQRVVTQWLANKPQALSGGEAFKGLRQALKMMRRYNNSPDKADENALGFVGLRHSLKHVSNMLEQFTGFSLHSQEFMRLLQSNEGLDEILVTLEDEFRAALAEVRKVNKNQSAPDGSSNDTQAQGSAKTLPADSQESTTLKTPEKHVQGEETELSEDENLPDAPSPITIQHSSHKLELDEVKAVPATKGHKGLPPRTPQKFNSANLNAYVLPSSMTPGRTVLRAEEDGFLSTQNGDEDMAGKLQAHKRRRSATIDLLLLLSKLGLRREQRVSDHLYHSLAQFLEGGNKEICALENLDQQSAIELLGYLESFPNAMKEDPRIERLAMICKARLVLMVAIDSVDEICDELLSQPHVTGHVRDVATYCLNFSGALIGTQMSILTKAKEELQSKAASRIQAWRRSMREAEEKVTELPSKQGDSFATVISPPWTAFPRRASNLRSWQSFDVRDGAGSGSPKTKMVEPPSPTEDGRRPNWTMQSNSTLESINLMANSSSRYIMHTEELMQNAAIQATLPRSESTEDASPTNVMARRRELELRGRQTLTERPVRSMFQVKDIDMTTFPLGPQRSGKGGSGKANLSGQFSTHVSSGLASLTGGTKSSTSQQSPAFQHDLASLASSNSITSSPFYQGSDIGLKGEVPINPVHALYGILRHLSRVVVSEARQNLSGSYDLTQKMKTLQTHVKKLKAVHPRVCVADNETREGLNRLPKASEELSKFIREHKYGANQTPYCYDYQLGVMAFFPPCELDTATQPPDDTSAYFRKILSTVFDLMPVDSEALHDLTETAVISQHASAGYALTTTLHYVDKLCKTSYMVDHHLGDETAGIEGTVTGGYLRFDPDAQKYVLTEESGHYGRRWTNPGTRQSLDKFMDGSQLKDSYVLKPFFRNGGKPATHINDLFAFAADESPSTSRPGSPCQLTPSTTLLATPVLEQAVTEDSTKAMDNPSPKEDSNTAVQGVEEAADTDWDFGDD